MSVRKVIESQPFLIMANVLSGILSVVIIGLVADNLVFVRSSGAETGMTNIVYNVTINRTEVVQGTPIALLPLDLHLASYWLMLAASICGFVDTVLLGGVLCWRRMKSAEIQVERGETTDRNLHPQTPISIFVATFAFCLSLATTIYSWYDWSASGSFDPSSNLNLNSNERYTDNFFTPDGWFCQLEDYIPQEVESNNLENLCKEGTAARTMTLAVTVLSAFVLYGVLYRTYKRRQNAQSSGAITYQERRQSAMSEARTVVPEEKSAAENEKRGMGKN